MQSFKTAAPTFTVSNPDMYCHSPFYLRSDEGGKDGTRFVDLGEFEHSAGFHQQEAVDLCRSSVYTELKTNNATCVSNNVQFPGLSTSMGSTEVGSSATGVDTGQLMLAKSGLNTVVSVGNGGALGNGNFENWADSSLADHSHSHQTDTSTDVDTDDRNQFCGTQHKPLRVADSVEHSKGKCGDHKTLRRLAQNREAARKSRLRKKAYVQQLENSRLKLTQLEQEMKRVRPQGISTGTGLAVEQSHCTGGNGALAFDMDYACWIDEHQRLINDLRLAVTSQLGDNELRLLVDEVMSHYDEIFRLKSIGAKSDVFHMLSGMWKTPAERCFMWLGGFRSSELLKILGNHLEPLTDQQLVGICNLQQSSLQAEDALTQGMEALEQTLVDTLSSNCLGPAGSGNVADYMGQMAIAMGKLAMLESFLYQADILRQQTLHQMHRILTTRQAARAFLVISDYNSRLRALSSLWLARPKN